MLPSVRHHNMRHPPTDQVIADFLRLRAGKGQLIAAALARHIGVQPSAITPVLRGERTFPLKNLDAAADFFGLDVVEFIQLARREVSDSIPPEDAERLRLLHFETRTNGADEDDSDNE